MSVTTRSTRIDETQAVTNRVALDVGVQPIRHGRSGQQWRPRRAVVRWTRDRIGRVEWSEWELTVTVTGPRIRQDGRDSWVDHTVQVHSEDDLATAGDVPADLVAWVRGAKPSLDLPRPA